MWYLRYIVMDVEYTVAVGAPTRAAAQGAVEKRHPDGVIYMVECRKVPDGDCLLLTERKP